jgi:hypothetical protein
MRKDHLIRRHIVQQLAVASVDVGPQLVSFGQGLGSA